MRTLWPLAILLVASTAAAGAGALTVNIVDVRADRLGTEVHVQVDLAGTTGALLPAHPIVGEVTVIAPTPCWADFPGSCADVVDERTRPVAALGLLGPAWAATAGPWDYPAALGGFACQRLEVLAEVREGASTASAAWEGTVCA